MGGSSMLQTGRWLLGMTLVVLAIKVVEAAVLDKDSSDLERFFLGRTVNPICFHNLALCKIACESCDKCYQEYVDCGMSSYYSTKKTATSSTVDLGADAASGSTTLLDDGLEGGATKGSVFTLPRIPVIKLPRIPVIKHPSSWQSVLVSKIRGAIVRTTTSTTTDATDGHGSDVPEHSASVQGPGTNDQSTKGPKSAPRDGDHNQRNTTDSFQHGKHHHPHHHEASAGHSKGKPRPINSTVSAGNITATNTEGSLEQSTLPHEFHDSTTESADHHSTEAATTPSHDGDHSAHGDASASTTHHPPSSPNTETSSPTEPEVPPVSTPTRGTTTHKKPHHHHHSKAATPKPSSETKGAPVSSPTAEGTTTRKPHRHSKASTPKSHSSTGTKVPPVPTSAPADTTTPTESAHPPSAAPNPELPPSAPVSTPSAADTTTPTESAHPPSGASNPEQPSSVSDSPPTEINHPPSSPDAEQPSSTWGPEEPPAPTPPADW